MRIPATTPSRRRERYAAESSRRSSSSRPTTSSTISIRACRATSCRSLLAASIRSCARPASSPVASRELTVVAVGPDILEGAEAQLLQVVHPRLVGAFEVLRLVLADESVVGVDRLPAVDDHVAIRLVDVAQELGADVADPLPKELRPLPFRAVRVLERHRVARVVAKDDRDQRTPPRSWCALKKFSLPAVAIADEALISRQSAAAATICAKR